MTLAGPGFKHPEFMPPNSTGQRNSRNRRGSARGNVCSVLSLPVSRKSLAGCSVGRAGVPATSCHPLYKPSNLMPLASHMQNLSNPLWQAKHAVSSASLKEFFTLATKFCALRNGRVLQLMRFLLDSAQQAIFPTMRTYKPPCLCDEKVFVPYCHECVLLLGQYPCCHPCFLSCFHCFYTMPFALLS